MMEAPVDRISNLPDSLLHHIHSFLEIKDGARTCVLSKTCKYIWTTVPNLHFSFISGNSVTSSSDIDKFLDFVDGTLHNHNSSNIDKFSLSCNHGLNETRVHSWISTVIRGNVKELSLDIDLNHQRCIPSSLFTCESLVSLELDTYPSIHLPKYINFPRLKRLKLCVFEISDESWNEDLFSKSPLLEELILNHCIYRLRNFCISIPTLKLLDIDTCSDGENVVQDCVFKIDAPRLARFSYWGYVAKEFVLCSFPELVEAAVDFTIQDYGGVEEISRLLRALAHVKCLTVCNRTLEVICSTSYLSNNLLTFHNVRKLNISGELTTNQRLIALLKAIPKLESLVFLENMNDEIEVDRLNHGNEDEGDTIDAPECEDKYEDHSWSLDIATTGYLFPHLISVCFQEFVGNPREVKWARLILRNAKALQMMTIRYYESPVDFVNVNSEKQVMAEIPTFPRASPGCAIKFFSMDWKLVFCC